MLAYLAVTTEKRGAPLAPPETHFFFLGEDFKDTPAAVQAAQETYWERKLWQKPWFNQQLLLRANNDESGGEASASWEAIPFLTHFLPEEEKNGRSSAAPRSL